MSPEGKKLLLVDDNEDVRHIYAAAFSGEGFDVKHAADGQEAWDTIAGGYIPDVVVTGILMPRMTGFDLVRKMQADPKLAAIPVAILSHRGRQEDRDTAKGLKVDDFIFQGITPLVEIVRRVKLLVGMHRSYTIHLERDAYDSEPFVDLLDRQKQTSIGSERNKKFFLEIEPTAEAGEFKIKFIAK